MADLSLPQRLAYSRQWLLTGHLGPLEMRSMGADPWNLQTPAPLRMNAAVANALRQLADDLEQQGVQVGGVQALLLDQPLRQEPQMESQPQHGGVGVSRIELGRLCAAIALRHGLVLRDRYSMSPLEIEHAAAGDQFARGVLACVAQVVLLLDKSLDSGQALPDLFLQPVRKDVEGPGGSSWRSL